MTCTLLIPAAVRSGSWSSTGDSRSATAHVGGRLARQPRQPGWRGAYGGSKGGLEHLTRSRSAARSATLSARTMTGRNGVPEDLAGAAVFPSSHTVL